MKTNKTYEINKSSNGLYQIIINSKIIKTPLGKNLDIPSRKVANAILKNLKKSKKNVLVSEFKITCTAIDKIALSKKQYLDNLLLILQTDVILFFSENQIDLYNKQKKLWTPLIIWMKERFELDLSYSKNLNITLLSDKNLKKIKNFINSLNNYELSALISLTDITNSLIISLALFESKISYKKAFDLSFLEELYQISIWGKDVEALDRLDSIKLDIKCVKDYFDSIVMKKLV